MKTACISECERKFRQGRWSQQLGEEIWQLVEHSSNAKSVLLAYDIQHCLSGLSCEHLDWFDTWQKNQKPVCWPLYWRLLSAELQLGMMDKAECRLESLKKERWSLRRTLALHHFPLALNYLNHQKCSQLHFLTSRLMKLATGLLERTSTLPEYCDGSIIQKNRNSLPKRIAVVGNGPSIIGKAAGKRIDAADLVIRFNQVHTDESVRLDTGQRTDLWVVSPGFRINGSKMASNELCLSGPAPFMRSSRYWSRLARLPFTNLALTPLDSWYALVSLLEAPPSAGILVLDALIRHFPNLQIESHGFTIDTSESGDAERAGRHYGDSHTVSTRHDWHKESLLIRQWISTGKLRQG